MKKRHKKKASKVEKYHDRVARTYDAMYEGSRYWDLYREITWRHLKRYLPTLGKTCLDGGCGTGLWGLRLARGGYDVILQDISAGMLDKAAEKARNQGLEHRCTFLKGDFETLEGVEDNSIALLTAQGDPLSCVKNPRRAVQSIYRVLEPEGKAVISVDGLYGGSFFFLERNDIGGLEKYLRNGKTNWQTDERGEQFPTTAFSAAKLRKLFEEGGFEVLSLIGKPVFPLRRYRRLLENRDTYVKLLNMELKYGAEPELLGGAAHLEIAVCKGAKSD